MCQAGNRRAKGSFHGEWQAYFAHEEGIGVLDDIIRLERFCAALYRALPVEGQGLVAQAAELAHAAELEQEADRLASGTDDDAGDTTALTPADIRTACQLLIDVRRAPATRTREELALVREHFPEVDEPELDALEALIGGYTDLLRGDPDEN